MIKAKKIAVMQPYFLPHWSYFQLMSAVDLFVIYDDVNYIKKGWINRNRILLNGTPHLFTIPLKGASQNKLISEMQIVSDNTWKKKTLRTIELNYQSAPYYKQTMSLLGGIFTQKSTSLDEFLLFSLQNIKDYLQIKTRLKITTRDYKNASLSGSARIVDICQREKAQVYINPTGGRILYDKHQFKALGIDLKFLESRLIAYNQLNAKFTPSLSVIDTLMFNDLNSLRDMLNQFDLS